MQSFIGSYGFNIWSEPLRRVALEDARDRGKYQVTRVKRVITDATDKPALYLAQPVYKIDTLPTVESRRKDLKGFVNTAIRFEDLIVPLLSGTLYNGLKVEVLEKTEGGNSASIAVYNGDEEGVESPISRVIELKRDLRFGDYEMTLHFTPNSRFNSLQSELVPWAFMVLGLLLAAMLGTFLLVITGRNLEVENLVLDFEQLADGIPQLVWTAKANGVLAYCNKRWIDFTGMESKGRSVDDWHQLLLHEDDRVPFQVSW
ncbi:hypothetical protein EON80_29365, partial [bacterium]